MIGYVGTDNENLENSIALIRKEMDKLSAANLGALQLSQAKKQLIGQIEIANESNLNYLLAAGNNVGESIMLDMGTLSRFGNAFVGGVVAVTSLAFSPDSLSLASGSQAGTVTLWDLDVEQWQARACELAGRNLTQSEWEKYFPEQEYALTCEQFPSGEAPP